MQKLDCKLQLSHTCMIGKTNAMDLENVHNTF